MKLLTQAIRKSIPGIMETDGTQPADKTVHVKFFTPWSNWTWYAFEFDGEDLFFGLVCGQEVEMGYFSLAELESVQGPFRLGIERDMHFGRPLLRDVKDHEVQSYLTRYGDESGQPAKVS